MNVDINIKKVLIFVVVLSMSAYFSACASSKVAKKTEAAPVAENEPAPGGGAVHAAPAPVETSRKESVEQVKPEEVATKGSEEPAKPVEVATKESEEPAMQPQGEGEAGSAAVLGKLKMIHFDFDKSEIKPEYRDVLAGNAEILKGHSSAKVVIEGHCDEIGTEEYNMALGARRANAAKKYLVSLGVNDSNLSTISYGFEKPIDPGHTKAAHAKNRRAQFSRK